MSECITTNQEGERIMSLRLKVQRDGKTLRPYWYGAYVEDGKQKVITLPVKWRGTPPASGRVGDLGDTAFEASREKARAELEKFIDDAKRKGRAEGLTERLIESKTGKAIEYVRLDELAQRWRGIARKGKPTGDYLQNCDAQFKRFEDFMSVRNPEAVYLYQVKPDDAAAFTSACWSALSSKHANGIHALLNAAFTRFLPVGASNPFGNIIGRDSQSQAGTIHRKPFTPVELRTLLDAARNDKFMFPLVVCAAMTGMRRGDVCKLRWSEVDLSSNMLNVKTSKTTAHVEIPIFPMLREVLDKQHQITKGKGYVFPEAADMIRDNPDGLTWRFKKIVAKTFTNDKTQDIVPAEEIIDEGIEAIRQNISDPVRSDRMTKILTRYAEGQSVRTIEKETGIARASISTDLRRIEIWTGKSFVRGGILRKNVKASIVRLTQIPREQGQRAASIRDWHALRVTWITFALAAGVPMELVRRVTGHATVDVVLKHYFRPDREQFKTALANALPDVITGVKSKSPKNKETPADEMAALVAKIQDGSATEEDKKRLRLIAAKI